MKAINPARGGHRPTGNDYVHMQNAYKEGFHATILSLLPEGIEACILTGCVLEVDEIGGTWSITPGFVFFEGEIFEVFEDEGTFEDGEMPCFEMVEEDGPFNPTQNAQLESVVVHTERYMELTFLPEEDVTDFEHDEELRLSVLLTEMLGLTDHEERITEIEDVDLPDHEERIVTLEEESIDYENRVTDLESEFEPLGAVAELEEQVYNLEIENADQEDRISSYEAWKGGIYRSMPNDSTLTNSGLDVSLTDDYDYSMGSFTTPDDDIERSIHGSFMFGYLREGSDDDTFDFQIIAEIDGIESVALTMHLRSHNSMVYLTIPFIIDNISPGSDITLIGRVVGTAFQIFVTPTYHYSYEVR